MGEVVNLTFRKATPEDVHRLFEVRRDSILGLAPDGMTVAQSVLWASRLSVDEMLQRFRETEFWVAEVDETIVGWAGIRGDRLSGLYVIPEFANRGIGSGLLNLSENVLRDSGVKVVRLEASWNSEDFYIRRGYEPTGPRPQDDTRTFLKSI